MSELDKLLFQLNQKIEKLGDDASYTDLLIFECLKEIKKELDALSASDRINHQRLR
jgi:hypothetical protein